MCDRAWLKTTSNTLRGGKLGARSLDKAKFEG
jgi:hypothetical protein